MYMLVHCAKHVPIALQQAASQATVKLLLLQLGPDAWGVITNNLLNAPISSQCLTSTFGLEMGTKVKYFVNAHPSLCNKLV